MRKASEIFGDCNINLIKTDMREYTFTYTDHVGRTNQASRFAENQEKATEKFKLLYPNTYILDVE